MYSFSAAHPTNGLGILFTLSIIIIIGASTRPLGPEPPQAGLIYEVQLSSNTEQGPRAFIFTIHPTKLRAATCSGCVQIFF